MAGGKETPRQKMIGMMYLVLTALLALNVSKEILEAFVVMNNGLVKTNTNFETNNKTLYAALKDQLSLEPTRAKIPFENSVKVKKWSDEVHKLIHDIQVELISAEDQVGKEVADTLAAKLGSVQNKDKYDNCTRIMCGEASDGSGGKARILKDKLIAFKKNLLS